MIFKAIHAEYAYTTVLALCLSQYPRGYEFTFEDKEISFSSYGQKNWNGNVPNMQYQ